MRWLRRLFGTDFPDPAVGQVWRCARNGELMRVTEVHIHTTGTIFVTCETWRATNARSWGAAGWGIGSSYAVGLGEWRRHLRDERRELIQQGAAA